MELRVAGIIKESVVDGPGLRFVIFTQGCPHKCPGCHNPQTHDASGGYLVETEELIATIRKTKLIRGVTFSGGEPFMQAETLAHLGRQIKAEGLDIYTYTGFVMEQLLEMAKRNKGVGLLLQATDVLIDGRYEASERDLGLAFRGSRNQRVINVARSLTLGRVVLWEEDGAGIRKMA